MRTVLTSVIPLEITSGIMPGQLHGEFSGGTLQLEDELEDVCPTPILSSSSRTKTLHTCLAMHRHLFATLMGFLELLTHTWL